MYIITDKENVIIHISKTIGYQENGNVLVDNDTLAIAKPLVNKVYEVESLDDGVVPSKYCYTEEEGFYKNPNYQEIITTESKIEDLEQQITDLQLALAEIVEGGI